MAVITKMIQFIDKFYKKNMLNRAWKYLIQTFEFYGFFTLNANETHSRVNIFFFCYFMAGYFCVWYDRQWLTARTNIWVAHLIIRIAFTCENRQGSFVAEQPFENYTKIHFNIELCRNFFDQFLSGPKTVDSRKCEPFRFSPIDTNIFRFF